MNNEEERALWSEAWLFEDLYARILCSSYCRRGKLEIIKRKSPKIGFEKTEQPRDVAAKAQSSHFCSLQKVLRDTSVVSRSIHCRRARTSIYSHQGVSKIPRDTSRHVTFRITLRVSRYRSKLSLASPCCHIARYLRVTIDLDL